MAFPDDAPRAHFETASSWRTWLEDHHASEPGMLVISWRTATGRPAMAYEEMVEEALCFGWVDSRQVRLDDERSMLWFTPRRNGSGWSRSNRERVERLAAAGRMHPAGLAAVDSVRAPR